MKFHRKQNRIYTIMDFEEGDEIEFYCYPESPSSKAKGNAFYRSKKDGRIALLSADDVKHCNLYGKNNNKKDET